MDPYDGWKHYGKLQPNELAALAAAAAAARLGYAEHGEHIQHFYLRALKASLARIPLGNAQLARRRIASAEISARLRLADIFVPRQRWAAVVFLKEYRAVPGTAELLPPDPASLMALFIFYRVGWNISGLRHELGALTERAPMFLRNLVQMIERA